MFTDCPGCNRQFRIRADQISVANGLVKCGFCGEQFNSLGRLHDKPLPVSEHIAESLQDVEAEPEFYIPPAEEDAAEQIENLLISNTSTDEVDAAQEKENSDIGEFDEVEPAFVDSNSMAEYDFPLELVEEAVHKPGLLARSFWAGGTILLLLIIVAQLVWFNRDEIRLRYPEGTPYLEQLCEKLQCSLIRHRDISTIKLLNRDVRLHPRFEQALLVNATMLNESKWLQAYPKLQLILFNTNGELIAYRYFSPFDYLDLSIDIPRGMEPGTPIHFVLEVVGPIEEAVSFEIYFY